MNYVVLPPGELIILGPQDSALSEMLLLVWLSNYDVVGQKRQQFLSGGNGFYQGLCPAPLLHSTSGTDSFKSGTSRWPPVTTYIKFPKGLEYGTKAGYIQEKDGSCPMRTHLA